MASSPLPVLDDLINAVRAVAPEDPLEQLAEASRLKDGLADVADSLLGHFVDQARRSGCSWSQIGDALGVSKQAAQQRHTSAEVAMAAQADLLQDMSRFTDRARTSVAEAQAAAKRMGHGYVGTEHLLLGLLAVPDSLAAKILAEKDVDTENVEARVAEAIGGGLGPALGGAILPGAFTPRAANTLVKSLTEALALGHNYIGTEHILLALFAEKQGLAARMLRQFGVTRKFAMERVITMLSGYQAKPGPQIQVKRTKGT